MGKKKRQTISSAKSEAPEQIQVPPSAPSFFQGMTNSKALLITLFFAAASYIFSYFYTSFYQGEEGAQYMNALGFWHSHSSILGNWPKTGWKIIYAPIVLFGKDGVLIANCLFSAFTAYFTYKTACRIISKPSALPMLLLFSQTLWFILSFKFYSEILTAFFISVAIYCYYNGRYILFSLFLSYILILRQEFIFIIPYFAIVLFRKKKWLPLVLLGLFPFLYNLWGWYVTGDALYALHESRQAAALYKNSYPRQGFDHYFLMSGTIFNYIVITLVVAYLAQLLFRLDKKPLYPILVPAIGFFLVHCLFNLKAVKILTSTGGNLRYMLVISPLMALLAAKAADNFSLSRKRLTPLIFLIPLFIVVISTMTYPNNLVTFDKDSFDRDFLPALFCGLTILLTSVFGTARKLNLCLGILCIGSMLLTIKPNELCCNENFEQKKIVEYVKDSKLDSHPIYQSLALFNYFYGKNPWDFKAGNFAIGGDSSISKAPKGSIIIWDSHYAVKYGNLQLDYFNKNVKDFKVIKQFTSEDNAFAAILFEKIAESH
ncbi:MAG: hypothetical protein U0U70_02640 [Chitinophagaceae bacterium]